MANNFASAGDEGSKDTEDTKCCIYKIPRNLRKVNEEAYTPQLISIGPYHHGRKEFTDMENHKNEYVDQFYQRITKDKMKKFEEFIITHIEKIHHHYADPYDELLKDKFAKIILCDAVFIIELFLRFKCEEKSHFLLNEVWLGVIRRDLQLLENQLPYFVLEELYKLVLSSTTQDLNLPKPFSRLSIIFFQLVRWNNRALTIKPLGVRHFTDLCRYALVKIPPDNKKKGPTGDGLPNAVRLKKLGVKFKCQTGKYLVDIILEKRKSSWFTNLVELKIPCIQITDNTECLIRNVMALEQCYYPSETYLCSYIELMNFLINTEKDVDLLVEKKIINNLVGDNAEIAGMFNKLCLQIPTILHSYYFTCYDDLRDHRNSRQTRAKELFERMYVKIATGVVLFTVIKFAFSVLQGFLPGLIKVM